MATRILNVDACGFREFMSIGKIVWGFGGSKGDQRLHILRVTVVQDATKKTGSSLLGKPYFSWDVDLDIYLEDGTKIEVHTTDEKFVRKMMPYCWEIQQKNPRVNFYGPNAEQREQGLSVAEHQKLIILLQQLESEKLILRYHEQVRDEIKATRPWESYEVQQKQRKVLASQKRIWNLQQQIDKLNAKAVR